MTKMGNFSYLRNKSLDEDNLIKKHSIHSPLVVRIDSAFRRFIDILLSLIALILLSPIMLYIAVKIKTSSPGPIIYKGKRAGKGGEAFNIYKFRTMYERTESYSGPKVTATDDSRITPLGKSLRKSKLNELPQLWNVLKGDMSFVGPRPEDIQIVEGWPKEVREEILSIRPGITSPASVLYRDEEDLLQSSDLMDKYLWEILPSKLRLDQLYVRYRTILADIDVIFWTFIVLIPGLKGTTIPRHLLFAGPLSLFTYRYLTWFLLDLTVSFLAIGFTGVLWRLMEPFDLGLDTAILVAVFMAILFSFINFIMGLNRIIWSQAQITDMFSLAFSISVTTGLLLYINSNDLPIPHLPRLFIVATGFISFIGFLVFRYRNRLLREFSTKWKGHRNQSIHSLVERVVIIGCEETAQFAAQLLQTKNLSPAFSVVGFIDDEPRQVGMLINGINVLGEIKDTKKLIKQYDVGLVMFAKSGLSLFEQEEIFANIGLPKSQIIMIPDMSNLMQAYTTKKSQIPPINQIIENTTLDLLTGSYIWNHFYKLSEREIQRTLRYQHPLSMIFLQVIFFQNANINIHPSVRNKVIRSVVQTILNNLREIDFVGRYKEDEFFVLLPETENQAAELIAKRIKKLILEKPIEIDHGFIPIRIVVGVSWINEQNTSLDALIEDLQTHREDPEMVIH
jgi:diguanylate cyclase (GGDEF)-like protein